MRQALALLLLVIIALAGGDRALWQVVPASVVTAAVVSTNVTAVPVTTPSTALSDKAARRLAVDAFMQARGVAPGSPGYPWERVQYVVVQGDFLPDPGYEVAIGGTVMPEDGFVLVYGQDATSGYRVVAHWEQLARVDELRATQLAPLGSPGGPQDLVVLHTYDERVGAFFIWQRQLYLRYMQDKLQSLLELVTLDEATVLEPPNTGRAQLTEEVVTEEPGLLRTKWRVMRWQDTVDGRLQVVEDRAGETEFWWDEATFSLLPRLESQRP